MSRDALQSKRVMKTLFSEPAAAGAPNDMAIGFSGEEPATAGYHYYWWNFVWNASGIFSLTGPCF